MGTIQPDSGPDDAPSRGVGATKGAPKPYVHNAHRVVVGFPFSTIKIGDGTGAADVADLVARLCHLLADAPSTEAFSELAVEAEGLCARLHR
jgi:hypothetical protein